MTRTPRMQTAARQPSKAEDEAIIHALDHKVRWLAAWTIHHANHLRPKRDGLKVGGHQASCASIATLMSALYFSVLRPQDRVAVKPHASPVFHAIQYLLGNQTLDQLQRFRALGGAQSYPSRTKDRDDVDFSTGSVGLGVAITLFAALAQDYLIGHGLLAPERRGRMIALIGDAELDEGNVYEALIEGAKQDVRDCWWIIDYNRQSLDAVTADRMFARYADIFRATGWEVVTLKYGRLQEAAFARPGGAALKAWIDGCPNSLYAALTYKGGAAWRQHLKADIGHKAGVRKLLGDYDDARLHQLMINLGGHDLGLLIDTFQGVASERPHCFLAYTVKGWGLPFQGHKDNHAGLMNPAQMAAYQKTMGVPAGAEWDKFAGLDIDEADLRAFLARVPFTAQRQRRHEGKAPPLAIPADALPPPQHGPQATQLAFGRILNEMAKADSPFVKRILTTSPDVTVSTNLGGWVNQRGIFSRTTRDDVFREENVVSPQKWLMTPKGQHLELGIAENNLFLALAAFGLSASLFGARLLPIGTLYDPFIARGLDALNYACYQDARFMLVATPAGVTLAPEGGAHQSFNTPLIGMAQPGLSYFEPAFVDELTEIMRWGFAHMQADDGGSLYLRLSTRVIAQPARAMDEALRAGILNGGYWQAPPAAGAKLAIVYTGALAPEAMAAHQALLEDLPGAGLLAVPSPDRLYQGWLARTRARGEGQRPPACPAERLLACLAPDAALVTAIDGAPAALSWLGGVAGHRVFSLGVERFGQSADIPDLYGVHRIDESAILDACASALVRD
ncbi:MAG: transketolase [Pseudomonadota bacterium]